MGKPELDSPEYPPPSSVASSRVVLSLPPPASGAQSFVPGELLRPTITFKGTPDYTNLSLRLQGVTHAVIMGKERWQKGMMLNASMGGPAVSITSFERLTFLDVEIPLVTSAAAKDAGRTSDDGAGGGVYEFALPEVGTGELLPSYKKSEMDPAGVGVKWTLELVGSRSGMFRSNDKLSLEVPVSIPVSPPIPRSIAQENWPFISSTRELKFKGNEDAALTVDLKLSYHPLAVAGQPLTFSLLLTPSNPSGLSTLTTPERTSPKLIVMFSRRVRTTPIDDPSKGRNCDWAGLRVAGATGDDVVEARNGQFEWKGQVDIPKEERTVQSKGVGVKFMLSCKLMAPGFDKGMVVIAIPVFVPSSTVELPGAIEFKGGQVELSDDLANETEDLPSYSQK